MDAFWFAESGFAVTKNGEVTHYAEPPQRALYASEADAFARVVAGEAEPWINKADTLGNMRVLDQLRTNAGVPLGV